MRHRVKPAARPAPVLPASLRAAWGQKPPSGRGPEPTLSLARIVEAAVALAAREGVEAVSMSRVAAAIGGGTMSLYRHVEGKRELLALMVDAVFERPPAPRGRREGWRQALGRWARAHLAVLRRHPWVLHVPISGPPVTPHHVQWLERGLACLGSTALAAPEKLAVLLLVNGFVRNHATLEADLSAGGDNPALHGMAGYGQALAVVIDASAFPEISALIADADLHAGTPLDDFDFGLERILDGVDALVGTPRRSRVPRRARD